MLTLLLTAALGVAPLTAQEPDGAAAAAGDEQQDGLLRQLAEARGRPLQPPRQLAQHYAFLGTTAFHIDGREPITQDAEVAIGGPDRLRYVLSAGGSKNVFLLQDLETAWMRSGEEDFEDYGAQEFAVQTWLRWTACRFPWDLEEVLDGLGPGTRELSLDGPLGNCRIELGEDLLPHTLRHAEAVLELSDWSAQPGGLRMPATWTWSVAGMRQVERFEKIELDVLLFDRAFAPPLHAPRELQWAGRAAADASRGRLGSDSISVVQRPAVRLLRGPADGAWHLALAETGTVSAVLWEWLDRRGQPASTAATVTGELPKRLPKGVAVVKRSAGLYLRWLSYAPSVDAATSAASLRDGARQGKLKITGPVWRLRTRDDGRLHRSELLLPVREP